MAVFSSLPEKRQEHGAVRAEPTPIVCLRDNGSGEPLLRFRRGEPGTRGTDSLQEDPGVPLSLRDLENSSAVCPRDGRMFQAEAQEKTALRIEGVGGCWVPSSILV